MQKVGIIGAGICGLNTALTLHKNNIDFQVFESTNEPGGAIKTKFLFDSIIETGPNSINGKNEDVEELINFLSLNKECSFSNKESKNRYILKNNKIVTIPKSPSQIITSEILSLSSKLNLLKEPFIKSKSTIEESIEDFILRRLGQEFLDYIVNPFINGIYAGDPSKLCASKAFPKLIEIEHKYGSIIKGLIKLKKPKHSGENRIFTFNNGLQVLPIKMAELIQEKIRYEHTVKEIKQIENNLWSVDDEYFSHIVFTQPAYSFKHIKTPLNLSFISEIYYSPVTSVSLIYNKNQFKENLDGFGLLIPECEKKFILGVLFQSVIFSNRCPDDKVLLTVFVGGAKNPNRMCCDSNELLSKIENDLSNFLNIDGSAENYHITKWDKAIPQYEINTIKIHQKIKNIEEKFGNIYFGGNYIGGISLPNAISNGKKIGDKIVNDMKNRKVLSS